VALQRQRFTTEKIENVLDEQSLSGVSYSFEMSRKALLHELARVTRIMVQGGLSSTTRTCGKPQCPCHADRARRHGPNLYLTYREDDKSQAVYVPPQNAAEAKAAQAAWSRYWEIGCELAALNREQMRRQWKRSKVTAAGRKAS
jgi:hypothetical protein